MSMPCDVSGYLQCDKCTEENCTSMTAHIEISQHDVINALPDFNLPQKKEGSRNFIQTYISNRVVDVAPHS